MDRCWLKGAIGDALHALSCAAGYNIRWLLRAIAAQAAKAAKAAFLVLTEWALYGLSIAVEVLLGLHGLLRSMDGMLRSGLVSRLLPLPRVLQVS